MPTYRYEAMTSSGEEVVDAIEADDSKTARKLLAARGLFATKLTASAADSSDVSESEPSAGVIVERTKSKRQPKQSTGSVLLPCLIIGLAGIASGVYGVVELSASVHLLFTGEKADGVVTEMRPYIDTSGNAHHNLKFPIVTFQCPSGPAVISTEVASHRFSRGDKVVVLYPLKNPSAGRLFTATDMFLPSIVWSAGGLLGAGVAWLFGIRPALMERRRKQAP